MRPARPSTRRRSVLAGVTAFVFLYLLFGRRTPASYDPAQAAQRTQQEPETHIRYSVVVPTYHERDNIHPLVTRVFAAVKDADSTEIVLVDDNSRDGTVEEVETLKNEGYNVVLIVRVDGKGLSSAVLRGFEEARGENLVVMDADLQHPPEVLPRMFDALENSNTPFVLGTRYAPGVEMSKDWPIHRRIISWGARLLSRPLTSASDPMTGFFGIRKSLFLRSAPLNPSGFKIALELLLKAPLPRHGIADVPFSFGTRTVGESKLSSKVMLRYVGQLWSLYWWSWGIFFPILLVVLFGVAAGVAFFCWQYASERWRLTPGGAARAKRRKIKSELITLSSLGPSSPCAAHFPLQQQHSFWSYARKAAGGSAVRLE